MQLAEDMVPGRLIFHSFADKHIVTTEIKSSSQNLLFFSSIHLCQRGGFGKNLEEHAPMGTLGFNSS